MDHHPSYEQVLLDVNRCAGRIEHIRRCYLHRNHEAEPPHEDLDDEQQNSSGDHESSESEESGPDTDGDVHDGGNIVASSEVEERELTKDEQKCNRISKDLQYQRKLKRKLTELIVTLLIRNPHLHYYQGFHDVCLTFMIIYGEKEALERLDKIIDTHYGIFMQPTMAETQEYLELLPTILGLHDVQIRAFLEQAEVGTIFALSWVITWFSHVIPNERDVETIFTHLEKSSDPHMILYLCAEVILDWKEELLRLEPDMSVVHHFLCQLPRKERLPVDDLLTRAKRSFEKWPPDIVKRELDSYRRYKLRVQNFTLVKNLAQGLFPLLASVVTSPRSRTAIVVFVVASALALQFDRWVR